MRGDAASLAARFVHGAHDQIWEQACSVRALWPDKGLPLTTLIVVRGADLPKTPIGSITQSLSTSEEILLKAES